MVELTLIMTPAQWESLRDMLDEIVVENDLDTRVERPGELVRAGD